MVSQKVVRHLQVDNPLANPVEARAHNQDTDTQSRESPLITNVLWQEMTTRIDGYTLTVCYDLELEEDSLQRERKSR